MLKSISDSMTNFVVVVLLCFVGWTISMLDKIGPYDIVKFPNVLLAYAVYLTNPNVVLLSLVIVYYVRHKPLRDSVRKESSNDVENL